jgi:hypothetical protein
MNDSGFDQLSLGEFPNSGSASIDLPDISVAYARVMLSCSDNIFFAISDATLSIESSAEALGNDCKPLDGEDLEHGKIFNNAGGALKFDSSGGGGQLSWLLFILAFVVVYQSTLSLRIYRN